MNLWRSVGRSLRAARASFRADTFRRAHVGSSSYVDPSAQVLGWKQVRIGHHSAISEDTWLNVNDRSGDEARIVIGDNCYIGRRNFFSAGAMIKIGDYTFTGVNCHFLGSDHDCSSPFAPYITGVATNDALIEVGPNCWIGTAVTVLKNVRIGHGSIVGAGSIVTRDVPPFSMVVGNPARLLRRYDPLREEWVAAAEYQPGAEAALPSEAAYLETLRARHPALKPPLIASSRYFGDI